MKLHSDVITLSLIHRALSRATSAGNVAHDVYFAKLEWAGSRQRKFAYEIQLGAYDKTSGPTKSRHYKNSGYNGAGQVWAASYDEWGWFIAELFAIDSNAIFGPYKGIDSFNAQTSDKFILGSSEGESQPEVSYAYVTRLIPPPKPPKRNRYVDVSASNAREVRIRKATEQEIANDGLDGFRKLLP